MGNLTIRRLDDAIIDRLKTRARTKGRSLEADLRDLLAQASRQPLVLDPLAEADRIAAMTPTASHVPLPRLGERLGGGEVHVSPPHPTSPPNRGRGARKRNQAELYANAEEPRIGGER